MDRIKLAGQIVIGLNIAFGHNLPKSAVDVVIEVMKEFDNEEAAQQGAQRTVAQPCEKHGVEYCVECYPAVVVNFKSR
jgi:hypothetical protein